MARPKAGEVNKSEVARKILGEQPKAKVKDIVAQMASQGIKISANQVYIIKKRMKVKRRKAAMARGVQTMTRTGIINPVQAVMRVRELASDLGGMKALRDLVGVLLSE